MIFSNARETGRYPNSFKCSPAMISRVQSSVRRPTIFVESRESTRVRFRLFQQQRLTVAESQVVCGCKIPHRGNVFLRSFRGPDALRPSVAVSLALKPHGQRWWSDQDHLRLALDYQRMPDDREKVAAKLI